MKAREYIIYLLNTFHSLEGQFKDLTPENWNVDDFMKRTRAMTTGEKQAALFVANVWNPSYATERKWKFCAITAISTWDSQHRQAFLHWAQDPRWP